MRRGYILRITDNRMGDQTRRRLPDRPMLITAQCSVPQRVEPRTRYLLPMPNLLRVPVAPTDAANAVVIVAAHTETDARWESSYLALG